MCQYSWMHDAPRCSPERRCGPFAATSECLRIFVCAYHPASHHYRCRCRRRRRRHRFACLPAFRARMRLSIMRTFAHRNMSQSLTHSRPQPIHPPPPYFPIVINYRRFVYSSSVRALRTLIAPIAVVMFCLCDRTADRRR